MNSKDYRELCETMQRRLEPFKRKLAEART